MTRGAMEEKVEKTSAADEGYHLDAIDATTERQVEKDSEKLGPFVEIEVTKIKNDAIQTGPNPVATEVPLTIEANNIEVATMMCMPSHLKEYTYGFLFTSGFINSAKQVYAYSCSETRWKASLTLHKDPDLEMAGKRVYTSGCGKGVMYSNAVALASRQPLRTDFKIKIEEIFKLVKWLQGSSELFQATGCVHTVALSERGNLPQIVIDDVGRHNAVDKVIGKALMENLDFSQMLLVCSGRISSEILLKARRCGIAFVASRAAATHQAVLLAREMQMTIIGFVRGKACTIYSHPERIEMEENVRENREEVK